MSTPKSIYGLSRFNVDELGGWRNSYSSICGNKMPATRRCNRGFYFRSYSTY